jgi:hypothetical protein
MAGVLEQREQTLHLPRRRGRTGHLTEGHTSAFLPTPATTTVLVPERATIVGVETLRRSPTRWQCRRIR